MEPPQLNYVGIVYPLAQDGIGARGISHELVRIVQWATGLFQRLNVSRSII